MDNWVTLFAQKLAANEKNVRDKAVKKLSKWISAKTASESSGFSKIEVAKVWKGLFYCMWMSDKPVVQEELAVAISDLIHCFGNADAALVFIDGFFDAMGREWDGIDTWRLDKFMNFVRKFLGKCLELLGRLGWEEEPVKTFLKIISKDLLDTKSTTASLGLRMHFSDIFIEELAKNAYSQISPEKLTNFFIPFAECLAMTKHSPLTQTIVTRVFEFALRLHDKDDDDQDEDEEMDAQDSSDEEWEDQEEDEDENLPDLGLTGNWTRKLKKHELEARSVPFPKFDYKSIGDAINKIAMSPNTKYHKTCLKHLSESYWKMSQGVFDLDDFMIPTDKRLKAKDFSNAAERLLEDEVKNRVEKSRLKKATRKQLKRQRQLENDDQYNGATQQMFDETEFDDTDFGEEPKKSSKKREAPSTPKQEPVQKKLKTKKHKPEPETEENESDTAKPVIDKLMQRLLAKSVTEAASPAQNETPKKKKSKQAIKPSPESPKYTNEVTDPEDDIPTLVPLGDNNSTTGVAAPPTAITNGVPSYPEIVYLDPEVVCLDSDDTEAVDGDVPEIVSSDCSPPQSEEPSSTGKVGRSNVAFTPETPVTLSRKKSRSSPKSKLKSQTNRYFAPEGTTNKKRKRISGLGVDETGAFVLEKVSRKSKNRKKERIESGEFLPLASGWQGVTPQPTVTRVKLPSPSPKALVKFEKVSPSTPAFFRMATSKLASKTLSKKKKQSPAAEESPSQSKKVNFVLNKNVSHADGHYMHSVKNSPSLPFDARKTPTQGVLKLNSEHVILVNPALRRRAVDFF